MPTQRQNQAEIRAIEIPDSKVMLSAGIEVIAHIRVAGFKSPPEDDTKKETFQIFLLLNRYAEEFEIEWLAGKDPSRVCAVAIEKIPVKQCWGAVEVSRKDARVIVALFQRLKRFDSEAVSKLQAILKKIRKKEGLLEHIELARELLQETEQTQGDPADAHPDSEPLEAEESHDQPQGEDDDMRESAITKANATVFPTNQALIEAVQAICPAAKSGTISSMFFQAPNGSLHLPAHWRALVHEANRRGCPDDVGRVTTCNWNFDALMKVDPASSVMTLEEAINIVQGNVSRPPPPPSPAPQVEPQEGLSIVHATAADLVLDGLVEELNGDPAMQHALVAFVATRLVPALASAKKGLPVAPSKETYRSILDDVWKKAIPPDEP